MLLLLLLVVVLRAPAQILHAHRCVLRRSGSDSKMGASCSCTVDSGEAISNTSNLQLEQHRVICELTPEQQQAHESATAVQEAAVRAACAMPRSERPVRGKWDAFGGARLVELMANTTIVDIIFLIHLIAAGGIVPRWQDLPLAACITEEHVWRLRSWDQPLSLPILVLSYPWLDCHHPDRLGETLRCLLPIFESLLAKARETNPHGTVGVVMDFMSLPQKPFGSLAEGTRFKKGLYQINEWYAQPFTIVLMVTTALPSGADYTNKRKHKNRGWCYFEWRISSIVKTNICLWDLSLYKGATTFSECVRQMVAERAPPMSPKRFGDEMRRSVRSGDLAFTASADMEMVIQQYERGFVRAFDTYRQLSRGGIDTEGIITYMGLGWGDDVVPSLIEAFEYAQTHCTFSDGGLQVMCARVNNFSNEQIDLLLSLSQPSKLKIM